MKAFIDQLFALWLFLFICPSLCWWLFCVLHVQISEKPEDKKTSGTNRLSKDLSSEYNDLWIGQGQVLHLFVRETYISSFPFLEKWIWPSTNHWECVLFMLCQKLQHASLSLLVALPLFVIMLCVVWRKPQCVLFVMGARGWGRCVFNYHLVEWLMVRQSSTELELSVYVRVHMCVCVFIHTQQLHLNVCKLAHACFFVHFYVCMKACVFLWDLHSDFSHILSFNIVGSARKLSPLLKK